MMDRMGAKVKSCIGILFLLAGTLLFYYPDFREWRNKMAVERIAEEFSVLQEQETEEEGTEPEEKKQENRTYLTAEANPVLADIYQDMKRYNRRLFEEGQKITDAWSFQQSPIDLKRLRTDSDVVGYLEIPDIDLSMPLYLGATEENMAHGAVVLSETSMPVGGENTNCVIAGHRGWGGSPYFRDIDKLTTGSRIHINTIWDRMVYQVTGTTVVHETDCSILNIQPGKDMVTLFSCYPYMSIGTSYRLAIFCERTEAEDEEEQKPAKHELVDFQPAARVSDLLKDDLESRGIVIREDPYQKYYDREDQIRRILPLILILVTGSVKGIRFVFQHRKNKKIT